MDEDYCENRYRFTVAEEIGHLLLHNNLFKGVVTPEEYLKALDKITSIEHARMDKDAKHLGEAILMPAGIFREKALNHSNDCSNTGIAKRVEVYKKLADDFKVSPDAVNFRFVHLGLFHQIVF